MKPIKLFEENYTWTPRDSQTDQPFHFCVPESVGQVRIRFEFSPGKEVNPDLCLSPVHEAMVRYFNEYPRKAQPMREEKFIPVKNLITLSLDKDGVYLGNAHRWATQQEHLISAREASLGFVPPRSLEGEWQGMLHLHEVLSERCTGHVVVEGEELLSEPENVQPQGLPSSPAETAKKALSNPQTGQHTAGQEGGVSEVCAGGLTANTGGSLPETGIGKPSAGVEGSLPEAGIGKPSAGVEGSLPETGIGKPSAGVEGSLPEAGIVKTAADGEGSLLKTETCTGKPSVKWHPVELHTHTQHSDGGFTVGGLIRAAKNRGFHAICLSDHNTMSGLPELYEAAERERIVPIPAIEWTTYWGHMLVLDEHGYTDWRGVRPDEIDAAIASIHKNKGLAGIAHPFALDNPINTGYRWRFKISDWEALDFLEVWSRDNAPCKIQSYRALELWEDLLNRGFHITATSGRDWHREDDFHYAHTYVMEERSAADGFMAGSFTKDTVLNAIRRGRVCLAAGPLLTMSGTRSDGTEVQVGDTIGPGKLELTLDLDFDTMTRDWDRDAVKAKAIQIIQNGRILSQLPPGTHQTLTIEAAVGWIRADLVGDFYGKKDEKIALTNPIYIK